jgi:hypothetical protein
MEEHVVLARLRALVEETPENNPQEFPSRLQTEWLGKAHALIKKYNVSEGLEMEIRINAFLGTGLSSSRSENWGRIVVIFYRVLTDLELRLANNSAEGFRPGTPYDLFQQITKVLSEATKSLMVIDPYMDAQIFDRYLSSLPESVPRKLLVKNYANNVKAAAQVYAAQHGGVLEVRRSDQIHDRLIFADEICWILGQSIKDAAVSKPTYFGPLAADVSKLKLSHYEEIWSNSTVLFP